MSDITQDLNFLQGVKVVDFTQFEAGTTSTEVLAWFGAEVVKIENPGRGDPGRRLRPGKPDDDPWYFHQFNVNKKSLAINLKSPKGLEIVKEMLKKADVTVENMAPGTIERLGLDYESVKKINPGIIYCQIKGFGTGKGRRLQLAMQDAMIHYMRTCFCTMQRTGKAAPRNGAKSGGGNNAPSGLYPSKGGGSNDYVYLTTSRANPEHWSRLMKLIGREELIDDPRFATGNDRVKNEKELDAIIGEWTRQHDKREAMEKLIAVGVPSGAVFDTMELQNEPSFEERGILQTVHHHNGDYKMASWPVRIDGKTVRLKGSPALGADSAEVLHNWLGIGD